MNVKNYIKNLILEEYKNVIESDDTTDKNHKVTSDTVLKDIERINTFISKFKRGQGNTDTLIKMFMVMIDKNHMKPDKILRQLRLHAEKWKYTTEYNKFIEKLQAHLEEEE